MKCRKRRLNIKRLLAFGIVIMLVANLLMPVNAYAAELASQSNNEQEQADKNIVSFLALEKDTYNYQYKLALQSLLEDLPGEIYALDAAGNQVSIFVECWECVENYDDNLGIYHFTPSLKDWENTETKLPVITVAVEDETEGPVEELIEEELVETPIYGGADDGIMLMSVEEELPAYYNEYEQGNILPAIRNQGSEGACWAFAALGAVETDLIMKGRATNSIDLSELHLAYFSTHDSDDPQDCRDGDTLSYKGDRYLSHGGNSAIAGRTLANMIGAVNESYAPYDYGNSYKVPEEYATGINYAQITEVNRISVNDRDFIKKAVMEHGSVTCACYASIGMYSYTKNGVSGIGEARYSSTYNSWYGTLPLTNHSVMIVGWDDNFSKDNFYDNCKPEGDGAWLIRNSWGLEEYGMKGYFWLSYYDASYLAGRNVYFFEADTNMYDHVYAYDSVSNKDVYREKNSGTAIYQEFDVPEGQVIEAVGFENLNSNVMVELEVSYGDQTVTTEEFVTYLGYHTTVLDEPLEIKGVGDRASVKLTYTSLDESKVKLAIEEVNDYKSTNTKTGGVWSINTIHEAPVTKLVYADNTSEEIETDARIKLLTHESEEIKSVPTAKISDMSLNLSGRIGVNFYMDIPSDADHVVINDKSGRSVEYPVTDIYKKNSKYCYTYFMSAKETANNICVSVYDVNDKLIRINNTSAINGRFYYSIDNYLDTVLDQANGYKQSNTGLYNLSASLDTYGLSSRYYFGYNTFGIDKKLLNGNATDLSAYSPVVALDDSEIGYVGTTLVLDADTSIRHYLKITGLTDNYSFVVTDGSNSCAVTPVSFGDLCYVEIANIPAAYLGKAYELKIYKNAEFVGSIKYSAMSYASKVMSRYRDENAIAGSSNTNSQAFELLALCNALNGYNNAAAEYWNVVLTGYEKSVLSLKLSETSVNLEAGALTTLNATCLPLDSVNFGITWTSSNPEVAAILDGTNDSTSATISESDSDNSNDSSYGTGKKSLSYNSTQSVQIKGLKPGKALIKAETSNGVWAQCLVTVGDGGRPVLGNNYLNVADYMGDGISPTDAFNNAIQALTDECNTVYVPAGDYQVNAVNMIYLKSNINIILDSNAKLNMKANGAEDYVLLYGENISNVNICGGIINGERYSHKDTKGEWGMGIGLYNCSNINIYDMKIDTCWGDGIYIGSKNDQTKCNNINIINCKLNNNRRNNISIVAGDNVLIDGCSFTNADGTDPQAGLDIEPNYAVLQCMDIAIFNCDFAGNKGNGMTIANVSSSVSLCESAKRVNIVGCTFEDGLWNYAGGDSSISDSLIADYFHWEDQSKSENIHWRSGLSVGDNVHINDGTASEDTLIAYYNADSGADKWHAFGTSESNVLDCTALSGADDGGIRFVRFNRPSSGTGDCGYYINLGDISLDGSTSLETDGLYRFEYILRGSGEWGTQTSQTDWYFCSPGTDRYRTYMTTQRVKNAGNMSFYFKTSDTSSGICLDVVELRIYKVN